MTHGTDKVFAFIMYGSVDILITSNWIFRISKTILTIPYSQNLKGKGYQMRVKLSGLDSFWLD